MSPSTRSSRAGRPFGAVSSCALALLIVALSLPGAPATAQTVTTTPLEPTFEGGFDGSIASAPGYGFVAAWNRGRFFEMGLGHQGIAPDRVVAAWFGTDGTELTGVMELDEPNDDVEVALAVASAVPGEGVVALRTSSGLATRRFRIEGGPPEPLRPIVDCTTQTETTKLVAAGGGYWLVSWEICGKTELRGHRLNRSGSSIGDPLLISDAGEFPGGAFGLAATSDGGFWVAWTRERDGREILARRYGPDGAPKTDAVVVSDSVPSLSAGSPDIAGLPDGGALVTWTDQSKRIVLRALDASGTPGGPAVRASDADAKLETSPHVAISAVGVGAASWHREPMELGPDQCILKLFDATRPNVAEEVELDTTTCPLVDDLVFGADGPLMVLSHQYTSTPGGQVLGIGYDLPRFVVLPAEQTTRPPGPGFVPDAAPGFRYWVRIGGDEPNPRLGRPEPICLPETACVSGAIPGRSEVFVRMVGPKPNGYLWPTIVRFTTSTVEVWIEQTATGAVRYYHLDGAEPGSDDLTGSFDRMGFMPP